MCIWVTAGRARIKLFLSSPVLHFGSLLLSTVFYAFFHKRENCEMPHHLYFGPPFNFFYLPRTMSCCLFLCSPLSSTYTPAPKKVLDCIIPSFLFIMCVCWNVASSLSLNESLQHVDGVTYFWVHLCPEGSTIPLPPFILCQLVCFVLCFLRPLTVAFTSDSETS